MPQYAELPTILMHPHPERVVRQIIELFAGMDQVDSILDVGSGHGGVFDYDFWNRADISRRATCDIHSVREMEEEWEVQTGVDVQRLSDFYEPDSFDYVQCMEVLEHVPDRRRALEQLCVVARKLVVITSADELHHGFDEQGDFDPDSAQARCEAVNPHQRYIEQPSVSDLRDLGFAVFVERTARRQLIAWRSL